MMKKEAKLILSDGTVFCGWSFGFEGETVGEVVFNTAMTGYPESLTRVTASIQKQSSWPIIVSSIHIGMQRSRWPHG